MEDLVTFGFRAKRIVRLTWKTWSEVCDIGGLISRDNEARSVVNFNDHCGENLDGEGRPTGPYIVIDVPAKISATRVSQVAYHGDYFVELANGKILVVASPPDLDTYQIRGNVEIRADFKFRLEDFPMYSRWVHHNGNTYIITGYANLPDLNGRIKDKYPTKIIYNNIKTTAQYDRDASDWHRSMTRID